jgi:hypothetical protein
MMERERLLNEKMRQKNPKPASESEKTYLLEKYEQLNKMGGNIPGFQMLKDRVLKPLIVATEKVVEYYLNDDHHKLAVDDKDMPNPETRT